MNRLVLFMLIITGLSAIIFVPDFIEDIQVNSAKFQETRCIIGKIELQSHEKSTHETYRELSPIAEVSFSIGQQQYSGLWAPLSRIYRDVKAGPHATEIVNSHPVGSETPCWYKISDPQIIFLEKSFHANELLQLLTLIAATLLMWRLSYNYKKPPGHGSLQKISCKDNPDEVFIIMENLTSYRLTYIGDGPVTPEILRHYPQFFGKVDSKYDQIIIDYINKNGGILRTKRWFGLLIIGLLFLCSILLLILSGWAD